MKNAKREKAAVQDFDFAEVIARAKREREVHLRKMIGSLFGH